MRQTGASVETAKEVKIFGLNALPDRALPRARRRASIEANRALAMRRAGWGSAAHRARHARLLRRLRATSPGARCAASSRIGDLTFLAGSFRRLRNLLEGLLIGFSQVAGQALYLDDLFSFFEIEPEIVSPREPAAVPGADRAGLRVRGRRLPLSRRRALGGAPPDASRCTPARCWRWSARTAPARPRWSSCWRASTTRTRAASCSTATTCASTTSTTLRANIGVIFQDFVRYHLTAAENIAVGRIEARDDRARIVEAARAQPGRRGDRASCRRATTR